MFTFFVCRKLEEQTEDLFAQLLGSSNKMIGGENLQLDYEEILYNFC